MWKWILPIITAFWVTIGVLGRNPNIDLHFRRVVESEIQLMSLSGYLTDIESWPSWFYQLKKVTQVGGPEKIGVGSVLEFEVEPPQKKWRRFTMRVQILQFASTEIRMKIIDDSRELFKKLVSDLEWGVTLEPKSDGKILILGRASARTETFKGRIFGRLSERILLNQLFYADLEALGRGLQPSQDAFTLVPNM